jgi:RES domain-containing protein
VIVWRISNYADLDGTGGLQSGGRWHNRGVPVVYLAESTALAMLEVLVHFDLADMPASYQLLEVETGEAGIANLDETVLSANWRENAATTRGIGDQWLARGASALLRVPSVVVPRGYNYLYNPRHPDGSKVSIISTTRELFDPRLMT